MVDRELRAREREGAGRLLLERVRAGALSRERVALAAGLGDPNALEASAELELTASPLEDSFAAALDELAPDAARAFSCDCAERTLGVWDQANPPDLRPRRALEAARSWLAGEASAEALAEAFDQAEAASWCSNLVFSRSAEAARLTCAPTPAPAECAAAARASIAVAHPRREPADELAWQAGRLAGFLLAEAQ